MTGTLIERRDLQGDLHAHSTWSDGANTVERMCFTAKANGLNYLAITDHTKRVYMAGGMDEKTFVLQWKEIETLAERLERESDFRVLKGVECDVLADGTLDMSDELLARADWVIASLHFNLDQSPNLITHRILKAVEHPSVCVIAHPTGRIVGYQEGCTFDLETVFAAARETGTFLELNSNPKRLDLCGELCVRARELGISIVIDSDAHSAAGLDVIEHGIAEARRVKLQAADIANTLPWEELRKRSKKGRDAV